MNIMPGIPRGIPNVIPDGISHEDLMNYDTFFAEINITSLVPKSSRPYRFGHVFKRNDAGSKIFCNETADHYFVDKITLLDLMEFYDVEYQLIRGYYFNDGFNDSINEFIGCPKIL